MVLVFLVLAVLVFLAIAKEGERPKPKSLILTTTRGKILFQLKGTTVARRMRLLEDLKGTRISGVGTVVEAVPGNVAGHHLTRHGHDVVYIYEGQSAIPIRNPLRRGNPCHLALVCESGTAETLNKKELFSILGTVSEVVTTEKNGWTWIAVDVERFKRGAVYWWYDKPEAPPGIEGRSQKL